MRTFWWRALHLALLAVPALQALFGRTCFLTLWQAMLEQEVGGRESQEPLYVQQRLACSVGRQAYRGNSQKPRSSDSRVAGNQDSEVYRQGLLRGDLRVTGP